MSTVERLLHEAADDISRLTNHDDAQCTLCDGTTEPNGSGHENRCIINRLRRLAENQNDE